LFCRIHHQDGFGGLCLKFLLGLFAEKFFYGNLPDELISSSVAIEFLNNCRSVRWLSSIAAEDHEPVPRIGMIDWNKQKSVGKRVHILE